MKILTNSEKTLVLSGSLKVPKNVLIYNKIDYLLNCEKIYNKSKAQMPVSGLCKGYIPLNSNQWEYYNKIGEESLYGDIYQACREKDCRYVLKWQKISDGEITKESIENEVKYQKILHHLNVAPEVVDWWICENGGAIIMPALKNTARNMLTLADSPEQIDFIMDSVFDILKKIHNAGYYHGDAHLNNIMIDSSGEFKLIDMGNSGELSEEPYIDFESVKRDLEYLIGEIPYNKNSQLKINMKNYINDHPDERKTVMNVYSKILYSQNLTEDEKNISIMPTEQQKQEWENNENKMKYLETIIKYIENLER